MTAAQPRILTRMRGLLLATIALALLGIGIGADRASALEVANHSFSKLVDGTGTTGGPFGDRQNGVGVDEVSGDVYLSSTQEDGHLRIDKFDAAGNPLAFTAPELGGATTLVLPESTPAGEPRPRVVVDNSGAATQGRFYVTDGSHAAIYAFEASGKPVTGSPIVTPQAPIGIAVSSNTGDIWVLFGSTCCTEPTFLKQYTPAGAETGAEVNFPREVARFPNDLVIDSEENLFVYAFGQNTTGQGSPRGYFEYDTSGNEIDFSENGQPLAIDPKTGDRYLLRYAPGGSNVGEYTPDGTEIDSFRSPTLEAPASVAVNGSTGAVYVADRGSYETEFIGKLLVFTAGPTVTVPKPTTGTGENFQATSVTLDGTVDPAGIDTTGCTFEWGTYASATGYENSVPCDQGQTLSGSGAQPVTATITGLTQAATYHFRLVTTNANGKTASRDRAFVPSALPGLKNIGAGEVHSDVASLHATVNAEGADTRYHFEYGLGDCATSTCISVGELDIGSAIADQAASVALAKLTPGAVYHYRIVAENQSGISASADRTFHTFATSDNGTDSCSNAHVRQQTGAAQLLDCRAYELVSAGDTAGYDVESSLVAGEEPYGGYPEASNPPRVLYAVHGGGIPGTDHPTNRGPDPYVATRGENGWTTAYVGVPADNPFSAEPFSSRPTGASSGLTAFSFGGPEGCTPCFAGEYTGIPVRLANGKLVQGMAGSLDPGPTAKAEGFIGKALSADGNHLVFGSKSKFEGDGNSNGDLSIYDRNLATGQTHVVSKTPTGQTMTGAGIAELDISADGSHVLIGQLVSTDADGNDYYRLYMNVGDAGSSVDLTPGSTSGALFDGISADGSTVYFTTVDKLSSADTDNSADIYKDHLTSGATTVEPVLVSTGTGGAGNSDSCTPAEEWNVVAGGPNCGAVAIAGGGGVSADGGTIFFLSPELLDGPSNGTAGLPNLYVVRASASPEFVATIDSDTGKAIDNPTVLHAVGQAGTRRAADFQVTSDGGYAAFPTAQPILAGYDNAGHLEIYRYGPAAGSPAVTCASCNPTNVAALGDAAMAADGGSLTNDGRVFFTTPDSLVSSDSDEKLDVYEWEEGTFGLISTGVSRFDSSLLSAGADGTDVYFFTRDTLAPQDENGPTMKVYDARSKGGFEFVPAVVPCKASDECHGPGTEAAAAPQINSVHGDPANIVTESKKSTSCAKGKVKKHGKCVKKKTASKKHKKRHHRKGHRHAS